MTVADQAYVTVDVFEHMLFKNESVTCQLCINVQVGSIWSAQLVSRIVCAFAGHVSISPEAGMDCGNILTGR